MLNNLKVALLAVSFSIFSAAGIWGIELALNTRPVLMAVLELVYAVLVIATLITIGEKIQC